MHRTQPARGFTLIEIMFTVAIVGILAAIAYPSYTQYIQRAARADARTILLEASQWMERNYTLTQNYSVNASNGQPINTAVLTAIGLNQSPRNGAARYVISFTAAPTANAFTLQAVPTGAQVTDTRCGTLTLSNLQVRTKSGTGSIEECWAR